MGVPRFFIELLKKYKDTHFADPNFKFQYYFMDYNAFIYGALTAFFKQTTYEEFEKLTTSKREQLVANFIVEKTIEFVNEIKPEKLLYIAFDGPAPRSKMKLQRDRRYKAVKKEAYFKELETLFKIEEKKPSSLWNSASLSPGTSIMQKIANGLKSAAKKKKFMDGKIIVIVDDTNIPGEGEHKILKFIRYIKDINDKVCIYSPDADVIILSWQLKGNVYVMQTLDRTKEEHRELYSDKDVKEIIFSITKYRESLKKDFGEFKEIDDMNLSQDLTFLTFFIGNDFVKPIYFMKSTNKYALTTIVNIYKRILKKYINTDRPYLVEIRKNDNESYPLVNQDFMVDIFHELSNMEDSRMKTHHSKVLEKMDKTLEPTEESYESQTAAFEHEPYYLPTNPFSDPDLFKIIDYNEPKNVWNQQYYTYFFGINPENPLEFRNYKRLVCKTYLQSLAYCLRYYLTGLPSWNWYYPFRVAPMPSDILYFMKDMPKNLDFNFEMGEPYHPIEQLAMILPPHGIDILPRSIRSLITSENSPLTPYYPIDFEVDKVFGEKFIYSYALLPSFIDEIVRPVLQETFSKFTKTEKERNKLETEYYTYEPNNLSLGEFILDVP